MQLATRIIVLLLSFERTYRETSSCWWRIWASAVCYCALLWRLDRGGLQLLLSAVVRPRHRFRRALAENVPDFFPSSVGGSPWKKKSERKKQRSGRVTSCCSAGLRLGIVKTDAVCGTLRVNKAALTVLVNLIIQITQDVSNIPPLCSIFTFYALFATKVN